MNAVKRPMSFLAATKSLKRPFIGQLLTASGCIAVDRPQDIKPVKGPGVLVDLEGGKIIGKNTKFTKLNVGTIITL
jgi:1-acyl-sn-glycerol-3-phosphate acyltransferase